MQDKKIDEIEITPDMIAVGLGELFSYDRDYDSAADAVRRIFQAMLLEARRAGEASAAPLQHPQLGRGGLKWEPKPYVECATVIIAAGMVLDWPTNIPFTFCDWSAISETVLRPAFYD